VPNLLNINLTNTTQHLTNCSIQE